MPAYEAYCCSINTGEKTEALTPDMSEQEIKEFINGFLAEFELNEVENDCGDVE